MAQTATAVANMANPYVPGAKKEWNGTVTIVDNYATGGITVPASLFGMNQVHFMASGMAQAGAYLSQFATATGLLQLYVVTTGVELANASAAAAGAVFDVWVVGA